MSIRYVIQGAGAVGCAIGGALARVGKDVALVGRSSLATAIRKRNGLCLKTLSGESLQIVRSLIDFPALEDSSNTIILQTMKVNDTLSSLQDLRTVDRNTPIFCLQNGIGSEAMLAAEFSNVYGGAVRFTATSLVPGKVAFAGKGKIIVGRYPRGSDELCRQVCGDLSDAGFTAFPSAEIMQDKWLKLLINTVSCVGALTVKTRDEPAKRKSVCRQIFTEAMTVLERAGIRAQSTNGSEDSPAEILQRLDETLALADGIGQGMDLKNSTWQSLAKGKISLENDWYTGIIIQLGLQVGVPTPLNQAVLNLLHHAAQNRLGPESMHMDALITKAEEFKRLQDDGGQITQGEKVWERRYSLPANWKKLVFES